MRETFFIRKMTHEGTPEVRYHLGGFPLSEMLGEHLKLSFTGRISCIGCARSIKKTFNQGYCYPCFQSLAACDSCILKPELCHFRNGTCRDMHWGIENCLIDHVVYLSNTSGLKVGITRAHKKLERWVDQGALEAIILARVPERFFAGLIEASLSRHLADKTDWRALIRGQIQDIDLPGERRKAAELLPEEYRRYLVTGSEAEEVFKFIYPVNRYPAKALTWTPEKSQQPEGVLHGIRGQYLFIGDKAINVRKYGGYEVVLESP